MSTLDKKRGRQATESKEKNAITRRERLVVCGKEKENVETVDKKEEATTGRGRKAEDEKYVNHNREMKGQEERNEDQELKRSRQEAEKERKEESLPIVRQEGVTRCVREEKKTKGEKEIGAGKEKGKKKK